MRPCAQDARCACEVMQCLQGRAQARARVISFVSRPRLQACAPYAHVRPHPVWLVHQADTGNVWKNVHPKVAQVVSDPGNRCRWAPHKQHDRRVHEQEIMRKSS